MPDTGENFITDEELERDPETGEPYPIDPETGEATQDVAAAEDNAVPEDGDDRSRLTVEKGGHTFEMTEPDDNGTMDISVDDGSEELQDYRLDFGADEQREAEAGDFGPTGSGDGENQVYRPGPDGRIRIEDGNITITAEQPEGPDGPTEVTVDGGMSPATTYTVGGVSEEDNVPEGADGGAPHGPIRTVSAPGDAQGKADGPIPDAGDTAADTTGSDDPVGSDTDDDSTVGRDTGGAAVGDGYSRTESQPAGAAAPVAERGTIRSAPRTPTASMAGSSKPMPETAESMAFWTTTMIERFSSAGDLRSRDGCRTDLGSDRTTESGQA